MYVQLDNGLSCTKSLFLVFNSTQVTATLFIYRSIYPQAALTAKTPKINKIAQVARECWLQYPPPSVWQGHVA